MGQKAEAKNDAACKESWEALNNRYRDEKGRAQKGGPLPPVARNPVSFFLRTGLTLPLRGDDTILLVTKSKEDARQ